MTTPNYSDAERELQRVEESQNERPSLFKAASLLWVALDFQEGAPSRFELPKSVLDLAGRPQRLESAYRVFVEALGISESQPIPVEAPSPQWTRTPPSEDGYWFARDHTPLPNWEKKIFLYERSGGVWYGPLNQGDLKLEPDDVAELEFWPVPIEDPPA